MHFSFCDFFIETIQRANMLLLCLCDFGTVYNVLCWFTLLFCVCFCVFVNYGRASLFVRPIGYILGQIFPDASYTFTDYQRITK